MPTNHQVPPGTPADPPAVVLGRELTDAERARTLAAGATIGTLSTHARDHQGAPFGSVAPFGLDAAVRPVLCISELAEHTQNLRVNPSASLMIAQQVAMGDDPLDAARLTLIGRAELVPEADVDDARAAHLAGNPYAAQYIDYGDFALWRLDVDAVRYVGGYGRMSWVSVAGWQAAEPDPTAPFAAGAVEHLNADHADACLLMAHHLGQRPDAETAEATAIDRYGLDLLATGPNGAGRVRLGFDEPVSTPDGLRAATVALTRRARQASQATST